MAGIGLEQARAAKAKAKEEVAGRATVVGVGLCRVDGDYAVKVNLAAAPAEGAALPQSIDGVPVRYEVVGSLKAL
jgi:hypothetical protein